MTEDKSRDIPFYVVHDVVKAEGERLRDDIIASYRLGTPISDEQVFEYLTVGIQNDTVNAQMRANVSTDYRQNELPLRVARNLQLVEDCRQRRVTPELLGVIQTQLSSVDNTIQLMNRPQDRSSENDKAMYRDEKGVLELIINRLTKTTIDTDLAEPNITSSSVQQLPQEGNNQ